jgi:mRNA interferase MazF
MSRAYLPERGDIVWLQFDPQTGHEQSVRRPALVLSPKPYNTKVGLAIFCPVTSRIKGYPFEVELPERLGIEGAVLVDQVKSLDWRARKAKKLGRLPSSLLKEVFAKIRPLLIDD